MAENPKPDVLSTLVSETFHHSFMLSFVLETPSFQHWYQRLSYQFVIEVYRASIQLHHVLTHMGIRDICILAMRGNARLGPATPFAGPSEASEARPLLACVMCISDKVWFICQGLPTASLSLSRSLLIWFLASYHHFVLAQTSGRARAREISQGWFYSTISAGNDAS